MKSLHAKLKLVATDGERQELAKKLLDMDNERNELYKKIDNFSDENI
jgi:hypothetical protein